MDNIIRNWNEYMRGHPEYRMGQALFNSLQDYHPTIANAVRGRRHLDPFYRDENIGDCLTFAYKSLNS